MALATLSIDLVAQLASLQQGMDKAGRLAEKQAAEIEARYARLTEGARAFGAVIGGAISVAGLAAFFRTTVNGLDALNDLKDSTGATIENLSALEDIAARTGTSMDTVSAGLLKFNKVLSDAKPGSETANILKAIGLSAEELRKIDPAEALRQTAVALDGYADNGDKARLIQELFGKSTKEVAAFLKDLAEQGRLNATVTTAQAQAAEDFNKQLSAFSKNATDAARAISGPLLQALNQMFDAIQGKGVGGEGAITAMLTVPLQTVSVLAANVAYVLRGIGTEIGGIAAQAAALGGGNFKAAGAIGDMMRRDAKAAREEFDQLERRLMSIGRVLPQAGYQDPALRRMMGDRPGVPKVAGLGDKAGKGGKSKPSTASPDIGPIVPPERIAALRELEQTSVYKITALRGELEDLLLLSKVPDVNQPAVAEAIKAVIEQIQKLDPAARAAAESAARINAALSATPSSRNLEARKLVDDLEAEMGKTSDPVRIRQINEAIYSVYENIGALPSIAEPVFAELDEFTKTFAQSVQTNLGETLRLSLTGDFDQIGKLWANMLLRMATDALAADLTRFLFPDMKCGSKTGTSSVGSLVNALGSFFGGGRAMGGGVAAGGMYQVNEGGRPELLTVGNRNILLMGKQGGQVTPARAAGGDAPGGGITIVQNNNFGSGGVSRNEMAAFGQVIKVQTMAAVADAQRRRYSGVPA